MFDTTKNFSAGKTGFRLLNATPGVGKKKGAVARANLWFSTAVDDVGFSCLVNDERDTVLTGMCLAQLPFLSSQNGGLVFRTYVKGGGFTSQRVSCLKAIARVCVELLPAVKAQVKKTAYCWFDDRRVQRKGVGKPKARKSKQWVKR